MKERDACAWTRGITSGEDSAELRKKTTHFRREQGASWVVDYGCEGPVIVEQDDGGLVGEGGLELREVVEGV